MSYTGIPASSLSSIGNTIGKASKSMLPLAGIGAIASGIGGLFGAFGKKKSDDKALKMQKDQAARDYELAMQRLGLDREQMNELKAKNAFEQGQALRGNAIEDTEIGYKRANTNELSPFRRQLIAALMGKVGGVPALSNTESFAQGQAVGPNVQIRSAPTQVPMQPQMPMQGMPNRRQPPLPSGGSFGDMIRRAMGGLR